MPPLYTSGLLALGLALQLVFAGCLLVGTSRCLRTCRTAFAACMSGLVGTCLVGILAFLRHDVVLLAGELAALAAGVLLYRRMSRYKERSGSVSTSGKHRAA